jgi:hypothetical protein
MRPPVHHRFVEKAAAAMTSAVEVYNKPSFAYREESFAILALNAWELLLKAKILKDAANDLKSLRVYEPKKTKAGIPSKKLYLKRNRAGNPHSISIAACIAAIDKSPEKLPGEVKANLTALTEIRDNSVHYITASSVLAKQAQELASASVKNFVLLAKKWFGKDISSALNLVLPLSFIGSDEADSVVVSLDEGRLISYLQKLAAADSDSSSAYAVAVRVQVKIEKSSLATASKVQISKDPDAVKVTLSEQDIREKYPWDYRELCQRLSKRYKDFKQDSKFHRIRKPMLSDEKFAKARYLDPGNLNSPKKDFYNPNVLPVFDPHYTKA